MHFKKSVFTIITDETEKILIITVNISDYYDEQQHLSDEHLNLTKQNFIGSC
jgi:hypothetical protein